jgi:hypothetical protein
MLESPEQAASARRTLKASLLSSMGRQTPCQLARSGPVHPPNIPEKLADDQPDLPKAAVSRPVARIIRRSRATRARIASSATASVSKTSGRL